MTATTCFKQDAVDIGTISVDAVGFHKIDMAHPKCLSQFINCDQSGVAPAAFQAAQILLAQPRSCGHLLLGEGFLPPDTGEVSANKGAHVHPQ